MGQSESALAEVQSADTCDPYNPGTAWCNIWMNIWMNHWNNSWLNSWDNDWNNSWETGWNDDSASRWAAAFTAAWDHGWQNSWDFSSPGFAWVDDAACAHPVAQSGTALDLACSPVVDAVCGIDPSCCTSNWSNSCVDLAMAYGTESGAVLGTAHDVMTEGAALSASDSACVSAVCKANSACCTTGWDDQCVAEAAQQCYSRYLTRTRFEDERLMTDACIEPFLPGAASCPLAGTGVDGQECCRRALVLQGVYSVSDNTEYQEGRSADWQESITVGATPIGVTIVPDPVVEHSDGHIERSSPHHLWQAAGPHGTIYPDCSGYGGPRPCNALYYVDKNPSLLTEMGDENHRGLEDGDYVPVSYRQLLVTVISALITTDGRYEIDIRWLYNPNGSSTLPPDPDFERTRVEGIWYGERISDPETGSQYYYGSPWCYNRHYIKRAEGLVDNVPLCDEMPWLASTITVRFKPQRR